MKSNVTMKKYNHRLMLCYPDPTLKGWVGIALLPVALDPEGIDYISPFHRDNRTKHQSFTVQTSIDLDPLTALKMPDLRLGSLPWKFSISLRLIRPFNGIAGGTCGENA